MATINFYYRSKKKQCFLTAKLRFSDDKKNFVKTAKTPVKTNLETWDKYDAFRIADAQIKSKVYELRKELDDLENHIINSFDNEINKSVVNSNDWLINTINDFYKTGNEIPENLIEYSKFYLLARTNEIKPHLIKKINGLIKKLQSFEREKNHQYKLKEINESFKNDFMCFLQSNNYSTNYIKKQFSYVKQICNHAKYNGLEISSQLEKLTIKGQKVPKIYLNTEELDNIEKKHYDTENLNVARDWLLISAYTGQRVSDFMRFTNDMVRTENGKNLIEFTQKKTGKTMTIPIHKKVLQVINKNGGQFPKKLLDQKYNNYLKIVCEKAGINEPTIGRKLINIGTEKNPIYRYKTDTYPKYKLISSHVGRRSFATNFYGKIPTTFLIYITGHSTETMFLNYIGKSNKDLALEVADYFNKI